MKKQITLSVIGMILGVLMIIIGSMYFLPNRPGIAFSDLPDGVILESREEAPSGDDIGASASEDAPLINNTYLAAQYAGQTEFVVSVIYQQLSVIESAFGFLFIFAGLFAVLFGAAKLPTRKQPNATE